MHRKPSLLVSDHEPISVRTSGQTTIIEVGYEVLREHQVGLLRSRVLSIAERCHGRIVLDLTKVDELASCALTMIIEGNQRCRELGGQLVVCGLNRDLRKVLKVTRLDKAIRVTETVGAAVRAASQRSVAGASKPKRRAA